MGKTKLAVSHDTVRHLDQWLMQNFPHTPLEDLAPYRNAMLRLVANDEKYWTERGWQRVHDAAFTQMADRDRPSR